MFDAKILADSRSPYGSRVSTIQVTFPRFLLAEVNTHRVFSRNSASSRAIPTEKLIERAETHPFVPETFNHRVKGMGVGETLDPADAEDARQVWLQARDCAVYHARALLNIGIDKSRANRLLEPFMWHTAIITSTHWNNFFALRCPPGAEPTIDFPAQLEFQRIAIMMRNSLVLSEPQELSEGEWHLPLVTQAEIDDVGEDIDMLPPNQSAEYWPMISAGRCARVSYDTQNKDEAIYLSYQRAERLMKSGHMSPFEHQARPLYQEEYMMQDAFGGNLSGWTQFRKLIPFESNMIQYVEERDHWEHEAEAVLFSGA